MLFLLLLLEFLLIHSLRLENEVAGGDAPTIVRFCLSGPLDVPGDTSDAATLGTEFALGVNACFNDVNSRGGIRSNVQLELDAMDDSFDPDETLANTKAFLQKGPDYCFGFLGYYGSPGCEAVEALVRSSGIPFVGAVAGSQKIRAPGFFNSAFLNLRTGVDDQSLAMVDYAVRYSGRLRPVLMVEVDQSGKMDAYGQGCYVGIRRGLKPWGFDLVGVVRYYRNRGNFGIEEAVKETIPMRPDAVLFCAMAEPVAYFLQLFQHKYRDQVYRPEEVLFMYFDEGGVHPLAYQLQRYFGADDFPKRMITPSPVPNPYRRDDELHLRYHNALEKMKMPASNASFVSFEGYIAASVVVLGLQGLYGDLNRLFLLVSQVVVGENFIQFFYDPLVGKLHLDPLTIGPYSCGLHNADCTNSSAVDACNDGIRQLSYYRIVNETNAAIEDSFSRFDTKCGVQPYDGPVRLSVPFRISSVDPKSGGFCNSYRIGIAAAFQDSRSALLGTKDARLPFPLLSIDNGDPCLAKNNTWNFIHGISTQDTFAMMGYCGDETTLAALEVMSEAKNPNALLIAPCTGNSTVQDSGHVQQLINLRRSWKFEAFALVQMFLDQFYVRDFAVVVDPGMEMIGDFVYGLMQETTRSRSQGCFTSQIGGITFDEYSMDSPSSVSKATSAQAIIVLTSNARKLVAFMSEVQKKRPSALFGSLSLLRGGVLLNASQELKVELAKRLILSQPIPSYESVGFNISISFRETVKEYWEFFGPDSDLYLPSAFEGYLAGMLVTKQLDSLRTKLGDLRSLSQSLFVDSLRSKKTHFGNGLTYGPLHDGCSKTGLNSIFFTAFGVDKMIEFTDAEGLPVRVDNLPEDCSNPRIQVPFVLARSVDLSSAPIEKKEWLHAFECALSTYSMSSESQQPTFSWVTDTIDDKGKIETTVSNVLQFEKRDPFLYLGFNDASVMTTGRNGKKSMPPDESWAGKHIGYLSSPDSLGNVPKHPNFYISNLIFPLAGTRTLDPFDSGKHEIVVLHIQPTVLELVTTAYEQLNVFMASIHQPKYQLVLLHPTEQMVLEVSWLQQRYSSSFTPCSVDLGNAASATAAATIIYERCQQLPHEKVPPCVVFSAVEFDVASMVMEQITKKAHWPKDSAAVFLPNVDPSDFKNASSLPEEYFWLQAYDKDDVYKFYQEGCGRLLTKRDYAYSGYIVGYVIAHTIQQIPHVPNATCPSLETLRQQFLAQWLSEANDFDVSHLRFWDKKGNLCESVISRYHLIQYSRSGTQRQIRAPTLRCRLEALPAHLGQAPKFAAPIVFVIAVFGSIATLCLFFARRIQDDVRFVYLLWRWCACCQNAPSDFSRPSRSQKVI